jgi:hypothetical protein
MNYTKKFNEFYNERQVSNEEIWTHCFDTEEEADEFIDKWNLNSNHKNWCDTHTITATTEKRLVI